MGWYKDRIQQYEHYRFLQVVSDVKPLYPGFAFLILKLFINAYKEGLRICIFETYRSQERQLDLFNKEKTKLKKNGMHHFGVAADVVFRTEKNYPTWEGEWSKLGQIGRDLGLYWGGDWESFRDCPHFQLIPALWEEQIKIVNDEYPQYDNKIDNYLEKITSYYKRVKDNNYSEDSFRELINFYSDLFTVPKIEKIETIEIPEKVIQINKRKSNNGWKILLNQILNTILSKLNKSSKKSKN